MTKGRGLTNRQSKYQNIFKGFVAPSGEALDHPAGPLLLELATLGCPAEVGEGWSMAMLEAAIEKGLHPSAMAGRTRGSRTIEGGDTGEGGTGICPTRHVGGTQARPA
jgi:hypothetical protein